MPALSFWRQKNAAAGLYNAAAAAKKHGGWRGRHWCLAQPEAWAPSSSGGITQQHAWRTATTGYWARWAARRIACVTPSRSLPAAWRRVVLRLDIGVARRFRHFPWFMPACVSASLNKYQQTRKRSM
jgi:hypothetical protein